MGSADAIPEECIGRSSGESFCDGSRIGVCTDSVPSSLSDCGTLRRCAEVNRKAECVCVPGAVDRGDGNCVAVAAGCGSDEGGCDPLTTCSAADGQRTCGACPAGYTGDGESGCRPQLLSLTIEEGSLEPAFSPDVSSYRVRLPASSDRAMIVAKASTGATIQIEGVALASDGAWTSPTLSPTEHTIELIVITPTGIARRYTIEVERTDEM